MKGLTEFAETAMQARPMVPPSVACFYAVRELPYALDAAHDAAALLVDGRGDCLAKADLLHDALAAQGLPTRLVRFPYLLPAVVPEIDLLPARMDMHRAVQVKVGRVWRLVDATHDAPLHPLLTVAEWDGHSQTPPAYEPLGTVMVEGRDQAAISATLDRISEWVNACPPDNLRQWRDAYIAWLAARRLPKG